MKPTDVIKSLPAYSDAELRTIAATCQGLINFGGGSKPLGDAFDRRKDDHSPFLESLYTALAEGMAHRTTASVMPYRVFIKQSANLHRVFVIGAKLVAEFNAATFPEQTRAEQVSTIRLYAQLLLDHLESRSVPLVWNVVAHSVEGIPGILDVAFPGYARAGLLSQVQALRTNPGTALPQPPTANERKAGNTSAPAKPKTQRRALLTRSNRGAV